MKQNPKIEWGFYAVTPRIVRTQYKQLSHTEKWLYVCLKDMCGDKGTCYRTLKALAQETDLSTGNLSTGIRHLNEAGLIHAEKKRRSANPTAKEVWHISIVDIWQSNVEYCSNYERSEDNVQIMNNNVQILNDPPAKRSENEQQRSNFVDRRNNTEEQHNEEVTSEERENASAIAPTRAPAVSLEQESETRTHDGTDATIRDPEPVRDSVALGDVATVRGEAGGRRDGQLSEQTSPALSQDGADRTSPSGSRASGGRKPREKPPVKPTQPAKEPEPSFALTDEQMAFWKLWCGVWFNTDIPPRLNETAYGHVRVLAPHITTEAQLNSLIKHTRKDLQESQGIKRKTVQLGNLVHCYSGWKQAQIKDEPASNGLPPQMTREQRKAMPVW